MPIEVRPLSGGAAAFGPRRVSQDAQQELSQLKQHIQAKANGSSWPGYLRLVPGDAEGSPARIERNRWFSWKSKPSADENLATANYIKDLFRSAYGSRCSAKDFDRIMGQVQAYLDEGGDRMGSRHFLSFVRKFDEAALAQGTNRFPVTTYPIPSEVGESLQGSQALRQEGLQQLFGAGQDALGDEFTAVSLLSENTKEGETYSIFSRGQSSIYKHLFNPQPITLHSIRRGEVAAARLHDTPHVVTPTDYIVRRNDSSFIRVPADQFKRFVKEELGSVVPGHLYSPPDVKLELVGTVMPRAPGKPLSDQLKADQVMPREQFASLAKGLVAGVDELKARRAVHHDIKPANVMFDPQSGTARLIDLGGLDKLSKRAENAPELQQYPDTPLNASRIYAGTEFTMSPRLVPETMIVKKTLDLPMGHLLSGQHGPEVDRYSLGMTLLCAMEPAINANEFAQSINTSHPLKPETPTAEYLPKLLDRLREVNAQAATRLEARFADDPSSRSLIEGCFNASEAGPTGEAAWQAVLANPLIREAPEPAQAYRSRQDQVMNAPRPPEGAKNALAMSPLSIEIAPRQLLPESGYLRAATDVLQQLDGLQQSYLEATKRNPQSEADRKAALQQLALDLPRSPYSVNGQKLEKGDGEAMLPALRQGLAACLALDANAPVLDDVMLDMNKLMSQSVVGTSLISPSPLWPLAGPADSELELGNRKRWMAGLGDHPSFTAFSDPQQPGTLRIQVSDDQLFGGFTYFNRPDKAEGQRSSPAIHNAGREVPLRIKDSIFLDLRYTPPQQAGQAGRVEMLDVKLSYRIGPEDELK